MQTVSYHQPPHRLLVKLVSPKRTSSAENFRIYRCGPADALHSIASTEPTFRGASPEMVMANPILARPRYFAVAQPHGAETLLKPRTDIGAKARFPPL